MTDWCLSQISFSGPEPVIADLVEKFRSKPNEWELNDQLFGTVFFPQPDHIRKSYDDEWRQWAWDNWGCKYGNHPAKLERREPGLAVFMLKTDWNPPNIALCRLTALPEYQEVRVRVDYELQADFCDPLEFTEPYGYFIIFRGQFIDEFGSVYNRAEPMKWLPD